MRRDLFRSVVVLGSCVALSCLSGAHVGGARSNSTGDVVREDFSSGGVPGPWRVVGGEWRVADGRLVGDAGPGKGLVTFGAGSADFRFEARARFERRDGAKGWFGLGVDVPASGGERGAVGVVRAGADGVSFGEEGGAAAPVPFVRAADGEVHVRVEARGQRAVWFLDDRQVLVTGRSQAGAGVALAVGGGTVSFDDVRVTRVSASAFQRAAAAPMTVVAHRGASAVAPENTLVAQEVGRRSGAVFIENDVRLSRDRVPFLMHDPTVDRTTDGVGRVSELTAAQLRGLDAGSWRAPVYAGARVPTLAEQLADLRTRGGSLLLEIKQADSLEDVAAVIDVVKAEQMTGRVMVQSFDPRHLRWVRALAPEVPLGLLRDKLDADPVAVSRELGLSLYNPSGVALEARPGVVDELHAAGLGVWVWTVDTAERWDRYDGYGVDGVITNRAGELSGWLSGRGSGL
ncbi:glycerophosphodiester phosphodiesterase family protein [Streptomyces sp. NPDC047981]|uniref:glycerophosphodiester phosphodiesterase family protein n=1 Tax=Streptomyces sp. NPDC047981 TaxID=3154610 RepID=UPI00343198EE